MSDEIIAFILDKKNINSLQEKSMNQVLSRCKHAHYTDIDLRINGSDEAWEADWLKHLEQAEPANEAKEKLAKFGAIIFRDYVTYNNGYLDFSDEAYQFLTSLKDYQGIKEAVEELLNSPATKADLGAD